VDLIDDVDDQCSPDPFGILSLIFFWAFVILCAMVMLNLVIAVILENFQSENFENDTGDDDVDNPKVGRDHVVRFQEVWSALDPAQTYYITAAKLTSVIAELDAPLGVRNIESATKSDIQNIIMSCDIPNHNGSCFSAAALPPSPSLCPLPCLEREEKETRLLGSTPSIHPFLHTHTHGSSNLVLTQPPPTHTSTGKVHFYETLHALAGRKAGRYLPESEELKIRTKLKDRLPVFTDEESVPKYTAAHYHAALYVQAAVRGLLARYQLREEAEGHLGGGLGGMSGVGDVGGFSSASAAAESVRSVPEEPVAEEAAVVQEAAAAAAAAAVAEESSPAEVADAVEAAAAAPADETSS
jgi:hypothetical protein